MISLPKAETKRIVGHFSPDFLTRLQSLFLREQVLAAVADGYLSHTDALKWLAKHDVAMIEGGAAGFYVTNAEAISMLTDYFVGINAGTAAVIQIFSGSVPANADAANSETMLAELTCSATAQASIADNNPGALATFDTITQDSSANATGTATFFRILTQNGGTVVAQGTAGTATVDLVLNTAAITSGSVVSISAATIELEEGP